MYFTLVIFAIMLLPLPVIVFDASKHNSSYKTVLKGVLSTLAGIVVIFAMASAFGTSLGQQFMDTVAIIADTLASSDDMAKQLGMSDLSFDERVSSITAIYALINNLLPGTLIITIMIITYFEYMLMAALTRNMKVKVTPLPRFSGLSWPKNVMVGFLVIFVLSWIFGAIPAFKSIYLSTNVGMIFQFVFEIQGLAVMFFFIERKKIAKFIAVILTMFIMMTNIGRLVMFAIGTVDFIVNLRSKISQNPQL